ncbi:MAG: hypothetical protein JKY93_03535 [Gammaproteobacteria bacterium]|nr:hypothetical protein [Gammaproteobacteria bacterium]
MQIYQSKNGCVEKGWITSLKITTYPTGRIQRPTKFIKALIAKVHYELKSQGFDTLNDPTVKAAFWEYIIDLMRSPPNDWHHQAVASQSLGDIVKEITEEINLS